MLTFSIVVPAYNEEKYLESCLRSLVELHYPKNAYEIIVVDNNSTDATSAIAHRYATHGVRVVHESRQGYVYALIAGCAQAKNDIIAVTDADTEVSHDWLKNYEEVFRDSRVSYAVAPGHMDPPTASSIFAELALLIAGYLFKRGSGYNMAFRRSSYELVGGFNSRINFDADADIQKRLGRVGRGMFLPHNIVKTSSRRYQAKGKLKYILKSLCNLVALELIHRTLFFEFGDVREIEEKPRGGFFVRLRRHIRIKR